MSKKKIAVMIYPYFSLQEITCLTSCLVLWDEREITVFASSKEIIKSEDGFQVTAEKTFDEFVPEEYDCLILPGILNPMPALFDAANIDFLRGLAGKDIVIAAICSAPMLLAKAGLLDDHKFTGAIWDEIIGYCDFMPRQNLVHTPVCRDKNIITADGFAFREFATEVLRAVGISSEETILPGVTREYSEEELTYRMGDDNFKEFVAEYEGYLQKE